MREYLLSIYIPTYNRSSLIRKQLLFLENEINALSLGYRELIEVIINDNHSTDSTRNAIDDILTRSKFKYFCNEKNIGIVGNMYAAREVVHGKYLWMVSDDDYFQEGILSHIVGLLLQNSDLEYIFLNYNWGGNLYGDYNGTGGIFEDAIPLMLEKDQLKNLLCTVLMSASIFSRSSYLLAVENLKFNSDDKYAINAYASMAAIRNGKSYWDVDVWIKTGINEKSWGDIECVAHVGVLRALRLLKLVGYLPKEIESIKKMWIRENIIIDRIFKEVYLKKKISKAVISGYMLCLQIDCLYTIIRSFSLIKHVLTKNNSY